MAQKWLTMGKKDEVMLSKMAKMPQEMNANDQKMLKKSQNGLDNLWSKYVGMGQKSSR